MPEWRCGHAEQGTQALLSLWSSVLRLLVRDLSRSPLADLGSTEGHPGRDRATERSESLLAVALVVVLSGIPCGTPDV